MIQSLIIQEINKQFCYLLLHLTQHFDQDVIKLGVLLSLIPEKTKDSIFRSLILHVYIMLYGQSIL